jgi:hypothetical protein
MSKIKVNEIEAQSGSTITVPTGQNLVVTDGLATSSLPTVPVSKGGTGLTSLGTANQVIAVNSGASALEFQAPSTGKIKQVISTTDNTEISATTGTTPYNYSQLNTSITPTASDSKILVEVDFGCVQYGGNDSALGYGKVMFTSGGGSDTDLPSGLLGANAVAGSNKMQWAVNLETQTWQAMTPSISFLHSPSTTNALVYKVFFWGETSTAEIKINKNYRNGSTDYSAIATMTLTEIGA